MKKLLPALLLLLAPPAYGEIYTWKDTKGTTYYTNSMYEIPERYRAKAKVLNLGIDPKGTPAPGATGGAASPLPSPLPVTASPSPPPSAPPASPSPSGPPATSSPSPPPATVLPSPSPAIGQPQGMSRAAAKAARARQRATREEE